ncbi:hypothetical protein [uncultured Clostridium sp.]|uniref:hypothetical protein n=1 Tax=uncultured Clostridium sp. TaxID=59620 RepID=UPI00261E3FD8|nr:hypothetical protein [uncultured Clostridium sp.]
MKCIWCGKKLDKDEVQKNLYYTESNWSESFRFCSEPCEEKFKIFMKDVEKNKNKFLIALFGSLAVYVIGIIVLSNVEVYQNFFAIGYFILLGLILIRYPYGTPETNKFIGIKKTINLIRGMGVLCILGSLIFLL